MGFEPPSVLRTSLALRQAIRRKSDARWPICAIPAVLYTDTGSDFTSLHMEHVAADSKMQLVFSLPGQPRGRGKIERFIRKVNEMFLCTLDGYVEHAGVSRVRSSHHSRRHAKERLESSTYAYGAARRTQHE